MPDLDDFEKQAERHSKDLDEDIDKAKQIADKDSSSKDQDVMDEAETALGASQKQTKSP